MIILHILALCFSVWCLYHLFTIIDGYRTLLGLYWKTLYATSFMCVIFAPVLAIVAPFCKEEIEKDLRKLRKKPTRDIVLSKIQWL